MPAIQAIILFCLLFMTLILNVVLLYIIHGTLVIKNINKYFLTSLIAADIVVGAFLIPLSLIAAVKGDWVMGSGLCELSTYTYVVMIIASCYFVLAMSCDHYVGMKWPSQHCIVFSRVRSICWTIVIWLTAVCICVPPLVSHPRSKYFAPACVCALNWDTEKNYYITVGVIVYLPFFMGLAFCNGFILTAKYRKALQGYMLSHRGPEHGCGRPYFYKMNCGLSVVLILSWIPWFLLQIYETVTGTEETTPAYLHFIAFWVAMSNVVTRFFVCMAFSPDFRMGLKIVLVHLRLNRFCRCGETPLIPLETKRTSNSVGL